MMREAEQRAQPYLFKLRLTSNVKRMIARLSPRAEWLDAGQGEQGRTRRLRVSALSVSRTSRRATIWHRPCRLMTLNMPGQREMTLFSGDV